MPLLSHGIVSRSKNSFNQDFCSDPAPEHSPLYSVVPLWVPNTPLPYAPKPSTLED